MHDGVTRVALPDVPTMAEAGFPGQEADTLQGVLVPAGTPRARAIHQYLAADPDSSCADESTWDAADPPSDAAWLTCTMAPETSLVPAAACCTCTCTTTAPRMTTI